MNHINRSGIDLTPKSYIYEITSLHKKHESAFDRRSGWYYVTTTVLEKVFREDGKQNRSEIAYRKE